MFPVVCRVCPSPAFRPMAAAPIQPELPWHPNLRMQMTPSSNIDPAFADPAFSEQLRAMAFKHPMERARVIRVMESGRASRESVRALSAAIHAGATHFLRHLAQIYRITPEPLARLAVLENLLEEEGISVNPRSGLEVHVASRHVTWARRLTDAAGASEDDLNRALADYQRPQLEAYIEQGDWLAAIGFLLIGMESNIPRTFIPLKNGFSKMGFAKADLVFFSAHIVADQAHGDAGFELLARLTPAGRRQDVLAAVEAGADHWWQSHNVV